MNDLAQDLADFIVAAPDAVPRGGRGRAPADRGRVRRAAGGRRLVRRARRPLPGARRHHPGLVPTRGGPGGAPMRIFAAHTDSPTLKVKPRPDVGAAGWRQVAVEVYGGALWNSWLDRDLGLAGRLALFDGSTVLVDVHRPLLRVPQLAIHLDRAVNQGLHLDAAAPPAADLGPGRPARGRAGRVPGRRGRRRPAGGGGARPGGARPHPAGPARRAAASCWPRRGWTTWPRCTPGSGRCWPPRSGPRT